MSARPSLARQLCALNAEVLVRRKENEKEVRSGRKRQSVADFEIESLEAIVDTLRWLIAREATIKQRLFNDDRAPAGGCW